MAEGRGNRHHPRNLQGVLQMAVEASSASEDPAPREPMTQEMEFLRGALAEVCKGQMDEVEQMKRCLEVLCRDECKERGSKEEGEEALEMLSELCENLDNARGMCVFALQTLLVASCNTWAVWICVCRAVPREVQFYLLNQGALLTLLQLTDHDADSTVRVKALYAVPSLVREQEAGLRDFLSHDGFSVLMRGMQSDSEKLRTKSAFLLLNLLTSHPEHKGSADSGLLDHLESSLYELQFPSPCFYAHFEVLYLNQRVQDLRGQEESLVNYCFICFSFLYFVLFIFSWPYFFVICRFF
uniref:HSPA (heat shock 70kDa) binding protein, cytoplasmic cochaperone 1 n=1 Tax=Cyprinus carpio TaxID=7962 RepID=A0A8C1SS68_CYPCA